MPFRPLMVRHRSISLIRENPAVNPAGLLGQSGAFISNGVSVCVWVFVCLQAMFSLCMVESGAGEVTLQGVTSLGLKHALDFAYTGQVRTAGQQHNTPS